MTPMPVNPKVVLLVADGEVRAKASNIDLDLEVVVVNTAVDFEKASAGVVFNSTRPRQTPQPLNAKYRKENPVDPVLVKPDISELLNS